MNRFSKKKAVLAVISAIVVLALFGYIFVFRKSSLSPSVENTPLPATPSSQTTPTSSHTPTLPIKGSEALSEYPAQALFLRPDGKILFLNTGNLTWYALDPFLKTAEKLAANLNHEPHSVSYDSQGTMAAVSYFDATERKSITVLVDLADGKKTTFRGINFPEIITRDRILATEEGEPEEEDGEGERWLVTLTLASEKIDRIMQTQHSFILRSDSKGERLIAYPEPEGYGENQLYLINIAAKTVQPLLKSGAAIGAKWSPDNTKILTASVDPQTLIPTMSIIDLTTLSLRKSTFSTLPEIAAWKDNTTISAFSPQTNPGHLLDFSTKRAPDNLYDVNLETRGSSLLFKSSEAQSEPPFSVDELIFDSSRNSYYAISNQRLFRITP